MPKTIRIRVDRILAELAVHRLEEEGVPARAVSDSDFSIGLSTVGNPTQFSLIVPAQYEAKARRILAEMAR